MRIKAEYNIITLKLSLDEVDTLLRIVNMARADIFAYPNTKESIDKISKSLRQAKEAANKLSWMDGISNETKI